MIKPLFSHFLLLQSPLKPFRRILTKITNFNFNISFNYERSKFQTHTCAAPPRFHAPIPAVRNRHIQTYRAFGIFFYRGVGWMKRVLLCYGDGTVYRRIYSVKSFITYVRSQRGPLNVTGVCLLLYFIDKINIGGAYVLYCTIF